MTLKTRLSRIEKTRGIGAKRLFVISIPAGMPSDAPQISTILKDHGSSFDDSRDFLILLQDYREESEVRLLRVDNCNASS